MLGAAGAAQAACPAAVAGDTPEVLAANRQRLLCLQGEIDRSARERQQDVQIQRLENAIQDQQLQRRFDALPKFEPQQF